MAILKGKVISRKILRQESPGKIVFSKNIPKSKHFKEIMEKAKWI